MNIVTNTNIRKKFLNKFKDVVNNTEEFYDFKKFDNNQAGFSIKRKFKKSDTYSLIRVGLIENNKNKKKVYFDASYISEKDSNDNFILNLREKPLDIEDDKSSNKGYFYNVQKNELYKKSTKISEDQFLNQIYNLHIKNTKIFKGLFIRIKVTLKYFFSDLLKVTTKLIYYLLFLLSGDRYEYHPLSNREITNGQVTDSRFPEEIDKKPKEKNLEGKKLSFLGYEASVWSIIFYCFIHLMFIFFDIHKLPFFKVVVKNNFFTLAYTIFTLWILETLIPKFLKYLIKKFSITSYRILSKKIKIN